MRREITCLTGGDPSDAVTNIPSVAESDRTSSAGAGRDCSAAFGEIYERHYDRILGLAMRITRNRQDAEDAAQECFMQALRHLNQFSGRSKLSTWISRIAINAALMTIRRRRRFDFSLGEYVQSPSAARSIEIESNDLAPDQQLLQRELGQMLAAELAQLSPSLMRAVNLHYFAGLSARECALVLGISLSSAKARIFRARLRVRPALEKGRRPVKVASRFPCCSKYLFKSLRLETARRNCAAMKPIEKRSHE